MKAMLIGGAGFVGKHLAIHLANTYGWEIVITGLPEEREAILPHSLKKIGTRCFAICNIKELNHPLLKIENGLAIKDNSLLYCADSSLDNVIIPEGIEVINARLSFFNPLNIQLAQHKLHLHGDRQIFQFR